VKSHSGIGAEPSSSTMSSVFVRNLPFGVTQEELEHVFSDVGPVRKIDVIKDKGKRKSEMLTRGFAFVKLYVAVWWRLQ
jgi:nucleolar protein 4